MPIGKSVLVKYLVRPNFAGAGKDLSSYPKEYPKEFKKYVSKVLQETLMVWSAFHDKNEEWPDNFLQFEFLGREYVCNLTFLG
jgi:hypothetical protein